MGVSPDHGNVQPLRAEGQNEIDSKRTVGIDKGGGLNLQVLPLRTGLMPVKARTVLAASKMLLLSTIKSRPRQI